MITDHLTLLTDLYELTMMQGYFKTGNQNVVIFDAFYRTNPDNGGYAIFAGLAQIIDYIERLRFDASDISYLRSLGIFRRVFRIPQNIPFSGDIYAVTEGTVISASRLTT